MERALSAIKQVLCGTWILERSENVEAYLMEMGLGNCERKSLSGVSGKQTIEVRDDVINIDMQYGSRSCQTRFTLNDEFTISAGRPSKAFATWENGALTMRIQRVDSGKTQIIKRIRDGDTLVQSMTCNGVTCRRYMIRQPP